MLKFGLSAIQNFLQNWKKLLFKEMTACQRRGGFRIYKEFLLFKKTTKSLKLILAKTIELEQFFPKMSKNWYTVTKNYYLQYDRAIFWNFVFFWIYGLLKIRFLPKIAKKWDFLTFFGPKNGKKSKYQKLQQLFSFLI